MNLCTSWDSQLLPKTSTTSDLHMYPHNLTEKEEEEEDDDKGVKLYHEYPCIVR
jgi:hypothetical protein